MGKYVGKFKRLWLFRLSTYLIYLRQPFKAKIKGAMYLEAKYMIVIA